MDGFDFRGDPSAEKQVIVLVLTARDSLKTRLGASTQRMIIWSSLLSFVNFDAVAGSFAATKKVSRRQSEDWSRWNSSYSPKKLSPWKRPSLELTAANMKCWNTSSQSRSYSVAGQIPRPCLGLIYEGESNTIDVLIKNIRRKIDQDKVRSPLFTPKRSRLCYLELEIRRKRQHCSHGLLYGTAVFFALF